MAKKDENHATSTVLQAARNQQYLHQLRAHRSIEEAVTEATKASQPFSKRCPAMTKLALGLAANALAGAYSQQAKFLR